MQAGLDGLMNNIREMYVARSVLFALVRKDLLGRYKSTILGVGWHFFMPALLMILYYVAFTSGIRVAPIDNFAVYLTSGLFLFTFFMSNLTGGAGSITSNSQMVKKMYFPRELLVLAHTFSTFIVMIAGYAIVYAFLIMINYPLNVVSNIFVILIMVLSLVFAIGYVLITSSINVYYRDVQYFLSSITLVFFMMTPMYFVPGDVGGMMSKIIWLNPFTYYVDAIHYCIYYGEIPPAGLIFACFLISVCFLIIGCFVFDRLKRNFAERL